MLYDSHCWRSLRFTSPACREMDGTSYAEEVLVTKSELEEKKQRMSELETQVTYTMLCRALHHCCALFIASALALVQLLCCCAPALGASAALTSSCAA